MTFEPVPTAEEPAPAGSPQNTSPAPGDGIHKFVSFFFGERQYAVPAHSVAEVVGHLTPTKLPDSTSALLGIAPLRGDIVAVVDPGTTRSSTVQHSKQKTVVLRPSNSVELPVAFKVDRLGEILKIAVHQIRPSTVADPLAEFESTVDDKHVLLISASRIHDLLSAPAS
jgi:chemotaxis signal transduction protein